MSSTSKSAISATQSPAPAIANMGDERFSALSRDPRYRLPSRKEARTAVDPRFGRLFTDQDFRKKASVDRYGRKIKPESGKKELERLYRLEKANRPEKVVSKAVTSSEESGGDDSVHDEELVSRKRDPAREGGFSESEEEEDTTSDDEEEDKKESENEAQLAEDTAGQEQTEQIPMGEVSRRIAAVNLDWDHIRAVDIMAAASSFAPAGGRINSVIIYPSEFGRERLEKEELEGPPREIFTSSKRNDSDNEGSGQEDSDDDEEEERIKKRLLQKQADEGNEFDTAKLRQYQLERLRYYYALIECDTKATAKALYDSMDGREYLSTANFFDLRFVPDGVSFDDDRPKEECIKLPDGYKPNDFRTEALTHSKVRLTWDDDDTTRKEVQKRAFSRAEVDENDLQAYMGSDSSDAESTTSRRSALVDKKAKKREAERQKMRAALGLGDGQSRPKGEKNEPIGDMQITFTSGLSGDRGGKSVFENGPQDEESTRDRYIRKERERKQKRKEKLKATRAGVNIDGGAGASEGEDETDAVGEEDAGFADPFFTDPAASLAVEKKAKKAERQKKREAQAAEDEENAARRKELELLMADDQGDNVRHFDMREIEKAEKEAKRKRKTKKNKKSGERGDDSVGGRADEFKINVADPRFSKAFESHEYAIDPTNPRFKGTEGMRAILEEGRNKRKRAAEGEEEGIVRAQRKKPAANGKSDDEELKGLVARLKSKNKGR